jgi:hypothetical protein
LRESKAQDSLEQGAEHVGVVVCGNNKSRHDRIRRRGRLAVEKRIHLSKASPVGSDPVPVGLHGAHKAG